MKKQYILPEITIENIVSSPIMEISLTGDDGSSIGYGGDVSSNGITSADAKSNSWMDEYDDMDY